MTELSLTTASTLEALSPRRRLKNSGMTVLIYGAFGLALVPLVWLSITVVTRGIDRFFIDENGERNFNLTFLEQSMRGIFGGMPQGGIYHAIVGTLLITLTAALI